MSPATQNVKSIAFFAVLLGITAYFLYIVGVLVWPIFFGLVFAIVLFPLYENLGGRSGKRQSLAAFLSIFVAFLVLVLALGIFGSLLVKDAFVLIDSAAERVDSVAPQARQWGEQLKSILPDSMAERLNEVNLRDQIIGATENVARGLLNVGQNVTGNLVRLFALALVSFYATFYFLKNGKNWLGRFKAMLPLAHDDQDYLIKQFSAMVRTSLRMIFVMGAIQGFLGGLIFWILGINAPIFWGMIFAIASLVPGLGHPIIWLPAAIIFFITGQPWHGVILIAYGLIVMGLSDDILRPYLIGRSVNIHPFVILIATIGGITTLGAVGLIVGPIAASLMVAVWHLYEKRFAQ